MDFMVANKHDLSIMYQFFYLFRNRNGNWTFMAANKHNQDIM